MQFSHNRSFIVTMVALVGCLGLAYIRPGVETAVLTTVPVIVGAYISGRTVEKSVAMREAARDPNCDTAEVVKHTIK